MRWIWNKNREAIFKNFNMVFLRLWNCGNFSLTLKDFFYKDGSYQLKTTCVDKCVGRCIYFCTIEEFLTQLGEKRWEFNQMKWYHDHS